MKTKMIGAIAVLSAAGFVGSAHAATATFQYGVDGYTSTLDTFIRRDASRQDYNQGGSTDFQVQSSGSALPLKQSMIKFQDIFGPGLGQVPTGMVITSATLNLNYQNELIAGGATKTLHTYPILIDIPNYGTNDGPGAIGAVNWTYRVKASQGWGALNTETTNGPVADEDYDTSMEVMTNYLGSQVGSTISVDLTSIVQAWYSGSLDNYGVIIRPGALGFEASYFSSSQNANSALRPQLVINYEPVPEPASLALVGLGGVLMLCKPRRHAR